MISFPLLLLSPTTPVEFPKESLSLTPLSHPFFEKSGKINACFSLGDGCTSVTSNIYSLEIDPEAPPRILNREGHGLVPPRYCPNTRYAISATPISHIVLVTCDRYENYGKNQQHEKPFFPFLPFSSRRANMSFKKA